MVIPQMSMRHEFHGDKDLNLLDSFVTVCVWKFSVPNMLSFYLGIILNWIRRNSVADRVVHFIYIHNKLIRTISGTEFVTDQCYYYRLMQVKTLNHPIIIAFFLRYNIQVSVIAKISSCYMPILYETWFEKMMFTLL